MKNPMTARKFFRAVKAEVTLRRLTLSDSFRISPPNELESIVQKIGQLAKQGASARVHRSGCCPSSERAKFLKVRLAYRQRRSQAAARPTPGAGRRVLKTPFSYNARLCVRRRPAAGGGEAQAAGCRCRTHTALRQRSEAGGLSSSGD